MADQSDAAAHKKIFDLVGTIDYAVVTTRALAEGEGGMHARPMAYRSAEPDGVFWFFTKRNSRKVEELKADPATLVSFADPRKQNFVTIGGTSTIVEDRAKVGALWSEIYRAWFPNGPEDPDVVLIRVEAAHAEYWDNPTSAMVYALGYLKAVTTGKPAKPGDVGKADFA